MKGENIKMSSGGLNKKDISGQRFGKLVALYIDEEKSKERKRLYWWCQCDCNSPLKSIDGASLRSGNTQSCGCVQKEKIKQRSKKYNKYDLESEEYGIGYTEDGKEFWFDKEDYEKIKNYYWNFDDKGAVCTKTYPQNSTLYIHRVIMEVEDHNTQVDHIKHNRFDNRKSQLRIADNKHNNRNKGLVKRNTTGITGVYYNKKSGSWYAQIKVNYKIIHLGSFKTKEEATEARKQAENKYFGEWSYDNSQKIADENERIGA